MIFIPLLILFIIFFVKIQKGMFVAFLVLVATKSIMDAFWSIRLGPLSFSSVGGIIIPLLFIKTFKKKKYFPKFWKNNAVLLILALSLGLLYALPVKTISTVENIILVFNIFIGFYIIPVLIDQPNKLKNLLGVIMIGGIFPIAVSLFQFQTGIIFYERETAGLTRYVGFYHDAFPVRFYGLMTLLSCLAYLQLFKPKRKIVKWSVLVLAFASMFSIYLVFSKAAVGIIGVWITLLLVFSESRIKQLLAIFVGLSVLFLFFGDVFYENIEQLFSKEVGYQAGEIKDARYTLAGRGYIWQDYWEFWINDQNVFFQWFGDGINRPTHNEFLRILLASGIIGLLLFIVFLLKMLRDILISNKKTKVFCLMLFSMFCIDCIGLMPGNYYFYNIMVWGLIGLFLTRNRLII